MSPTRTPRDDDRSNYYALDSEVDGEVIDDNDHLASVLRAKAIAAREVSARGLLASIEHRASFEGLPDDVVIDLGFVQSFARPASPEHARIAREVEPQLRAWLTSEHPGLRQRAHFVLVLLRGPASAAKLLAASRKQQDSASVLGVLRALTSFSSLPAELLPQLKALIDPAKLDRIVRDDEDRGTIGELAVDALVRVDSPDAMTVLLGALDNPEVRVVVASRLARARRSSLPDEMLRQLRVRFAQCVATIAESRKDALPLPNRVAMSTAGALADLVERDAEMARQALSVFDFLPGPMGYGFVADMAALLAASIDDLTPEEHERIARQLMQPPAARLPATAAAWVRLDAAPAAALAAKIRGGRDTTEPVWHALARAYRARGVHRPELRELLPARILPPELEARRGRNRCTNAVSASRAVASGRILPGCHESLSPRAARLLAQLALCLPRRGLRRRLGDLRHPAADRRRGGQGRGRRRRRCIRRLRTGGRGGQGRRRRRGGQGGRCGDGRAGRPGRGRRQRWSGGQVRKLRTGGASRRRRGRGGRDRGGGRGGRDGGRGGAGRGGDGLRG